MEQKNFQGSSNWITKVFQPVFLSVPGKGKESRGRLKHRVFPWQSVFNSSVRWPLIRLRQKKIWDEAKRGGIFRKPFFIYERHHFSQE